MIELQHKERKLLNIWAYHLFIRLFSQFKKKPPKKDLRRHSVRFMNDIK